MNRILIVFLFPFLCIMYHKIHKCCIKFMRKIINIYIRVVHRSVWVRFMPNPEPTCWNRVEKKVICHRPAGVIGLGNSEHQWVAGGSVEFETARKWWIKHRSGENLTGFYEISPNLVKISYDFMRFRQIRRKSHKIRWDLARSGQNLTGSKGNSAGNWKNITESGFFCRILENFGWNLEIFQLVSVFRVLREENRNPTRQNRFLVMKSRRRPARVVGSAGFESDPVSSSGGSSTRMNLDIPNIYIYIYII